LAEIAVAALIAFSAPAGTHWLGDTIENSSDTAVYLSYLAQGADGHVLLKDLYAIEPNAARFDLVWSTLGETARTIPPIIAQEFARWIFTIVLVFAVYYAARGLTDKETHAKLATVLAFAGVSQGWLVSIYLTLTHAWKWNGTPIAPDVATEFSIPPILWGGAHVILSLALLITGLRLIWRAYDTKSQRDAWLGSAAMGTLFCFHPYFAPLFVCFFAIIFLTFRRAPITTFVRLAVPSAICCLPSVAIFLPLAFDPVFRAHHLSANILPLSGPGLWLITLAPFLIALGWRINKRIALSNRERWIVAWIFAALLAMLFPFPWKRKLTEGLSVACIFLTLPAWTALWDTIRKASPWQARLNAAFFIVFASLVHFHLLTSQLAWIGNPERQFWFYQPNDVFSAWQAIHDDTPTSSVVVTDDLWLNLWTPAETDRTVYVGHDQETPNDVTKRALWGTLGNATTTQGAEQLLDEMHANVFLLSSPTSTEQLGPLLEPDWKSIYHSGDITVLERL
jgi:hypothetical protein